jgi:hypothetical protein
MGFVSITNGFIKAGSLISGVDLRSWLLHADSATTSGSELVSCDYRTGMEVGCVSRVWDQS